MIFRVLDTFRSLFEGKKYEHRNSTLGDFVAGHLYEDLLALGRSAKLAHRISAGERVLNVANRAVGKKARRGDGTFGEVVPAAAVLHDLGYNVGRGPLATIEIGAETKVMCKAMLRQIDRVIGDLIRQVEQFQRTRIQCDFGGNRRDQLCPAIHVIRRFSRVSHYRLRQVPAPRARGADGRSTLDTAGEATV